MTAAVAAPASTSPQPGSAGARETTKNSARDGDGFARTLARRQATDVEDSAPRADATPKRSARAELDDDALAADDDALLQPTLTAAAAPPAPWPPVGLAGLVGMSLGLDPAAAALDADPADTAELPAVTAGGVATPMPVALASTASPVTVPATASTPAALADSDVALPLPLEVAAAAEGTEPAATADAPEPLPLAFALPAPAPPAVRAAAPLLDAPLPTPDLRGDDFEARFGAQLEWMAGQKIGHARIRISPPEMGPIEVSLQLDGERITADFISGSSDTRQALEHGLPRLRELLGEHGFQLAHAGVGNGDTSQRDGNPAPGPVTGTAGDDETAPARLQGATGYRGAGLLDAYA